MYYYRTEIEPVQISPTRFGPTIDGLKVTTIGSESGWKERQVSTMDGNDEYVTDYELGFEIEYRFVDTYPSVEAFKSAIEKERLILLTKRVAWPVANAALLSIAFLIPVDSSSRVTSLLASMPLYMGIMLYSSDTTDQPFNWPFSRFNRPGFNAEALNVEVTAFKRQFPDQQLRSYNPFSAFRHLIGRS